jgi:hypothetical protein
MMTGQARSSVTIMGLDTHMILETVPVYHSPRRTAHHVINRSSRPYAEAVGYPPSLSDYYPFAAIGVISAEHDSNDHAAGVSPYWPGVSPAVPTRVG